MSPGSRGPTRRTIGSMVVTGALVALVLLLVASSMKGPDAATGSASPFELPRVALAGVPFTIGVRGEAETYGLTVLAPNGNARSLAGPVLQERGGRVLPPLRLRDPGPHRLVLEVDGAEVQARLRVIPPWWSLLPALVAIVLALVFRHVVPALLVGVGVGALLVTADPAAAGGRLVRGYLFGTFSDVDHRSILAFTLLLGGMMEVVSRAGGGAGLARFVSRGSRDPRRVQLTTWLMGLVVFFDDYANALLVGTSMRPLTDRLRVSREKLAFLVDATAAPVASVSLISSWVGVELGYISAQLQAVGRTDDPYMVFVQTLPYRFYPLLMLWFAFLVAVSGRDFGPMAKAERRAAMADDDEGQGAGAAPSTEAAAEEGAIRAPSSAGPPSPTGRLVEASGDALAAVIPLATLLVTAFAAMLVDGHAAVLEAGREPTLGAMLSSASSVRAVLWASAAAGVAAVGVAVFRRRIEPRAVPAAWFAGLRAMLPACAILVLAWSLGHVCRDLHTGPFMVRALGPWLSPGLLPAAVFLLSALVSFATGTSWGTMAILFPLVVPLSHGLAPDDMHVLLGAISSILAGAVWGDHCSPISDTTVMSSLASGCDHLAHVRTQLPYALVVGGVSLLAGDIATGLGWYSAGTGLLLGAALLAVVVYGGGRLTRLTPPRERPS